MKTYTYEEALAASRAYFHGDELAATVWINKYAMKDSFGNLYEQSPEDMHRRLAKEFARIEKNYPDPLSEEQIFALLKDFRYVIPQGGPMTGIGNDHQVASLSNCFVIGHDHPADSYGGILMTDQEQVQLMKRRGGVGHDLSHIRPTGSPVLNSALTSTGVVPFMERFSNSTREVAQDGRRGALMLTISIKHPDSERFIDAKMEQGKVTGANVSVKIDDEFMRAALSGAPYKLQYPVYGDKPKYEKEIDAAKLWKKIIHNAWKSAEPGVLFWDTVLRESVADCYADEGYRTVSTNPCGEIPLCPYDSCRLIAMNLYSYVKDPFTPKARFDMDLFKQHVALTMRLMDDLIDLEMEKIEQILAKIEQDPEDDEVKRIEHNPMILRIKDADPQLYERMVKTGRRNVSMLTIAPTGTTSLMTQTTSGIEPVFRPFYLRRKKVNANDKNVKVSFRDDKGDSYEEYYVFHHKFLDWAEIAGHRREDVLQMDRAALDALVAESPYHQSTAGDVDWVAKVKMQGQIQKWVDHSISVTVNLPEDISEEMVGQVYRTAWESGCKGITVYREGSRSGVLVSGDKEKEKKAAIRPKKRPQSLEADVIRFRNGNEHWIALVGKLNGQPYEIFTGIVDEDTRSIPRSIDKGWIVKEKDPSTGKSRYDFHFQDKYGYPSVVGGISHMFNKEFWNYAKLISGVLRNGMPIVDVLNLVQGLELDSDSINTWKNGVERALKRYIPDGTRDESGKKCSQCGGSNLVYQEGCLVCLDCGYSKCG